MTHKRTLSSALFLIVALSVGVLLVAGCGGSDTESSGGTGGTDAATGSANLVREEFSLENFKGRPLLLNFWATW